MTEWNEWRSRNPDAAIDLAEANLSKAHLVGADLSLAELPFVNLASASLDIADLSDANLTGADLRHARMYRADLSGANLRDARLAGTSFFHANLMGADLIGADLSDSVLRDVNLTSADLTGANLTRAALERANLTGAFLSDTTDLTEATALWTMFANLEGLHDVKGLDSCRHRGPSVIDHPTLARSGPLLPLAFLRGCGVPDRLIEYLPSLLEVAPIQFYSVFISYSTANQDFADRLHADLQDNGVRCWFAPHDMQGGKTIHEQIDEAIRVYDRLLLILSNESMSSRWVTREIERAIKKGRDSNRRVLFPIALVPFRDIEGWAPEFNADLVEDIAQEIRKYFIPDFSQWKNHDTYTKALNQLLKALKAADAQPTTSA